MEPFKEKATESCYFSDEFSEQSLSVTAPAKHDEIKFAEKEAKRVLFARLVLVFVLVSVAAVVCSCVYIYAVSQENELFETAAYELGHKVVDTFQLISARRLDAIAYLAFTISSNAIALNQSWPLVVVSEFEQKMAYTLDLAGLVNIAFIPFVTGEDRKSWEAFSVENQGWLKEGLALQGNITGGVDESEDIAILEATWGQTTPNMTIPEEIFRIAKTGIEEETGDGPYAPFWQYAPAVPYPGFINYNAMSHPARLPKLISIIESGASLLSEAWDISDTQDPSTVGKKAGLNLALNRRPDLALNYQDGPASDVYVPIFEQVNKEAKNNKVVGILTSYVYWQAFFYHILPQESGYMMAVLDNSCNQSFSYIISGYDDVNYIGQGDLHDPKYDDMVVSTGWNAYLQLPEDLLEAQAKHSGHCSYQVRVYPTQDLEDHYLTQTPLYFVLCLIGAFILTSMVFVLYDCMVEKRNRVVTQQAIQSTEVVNSLYPAAVRDRLFEDEKKKKERESIGEKDVWRSRSALQIMEEEADDGLVADFYESSTIMFADLAGFTSWSSGRPPKDVFHLLEALYGAFDIIANRREVFKVETIGDCYLAICGCPTPNEKHAIIMTKFASECMTKMDQIIQNTLVDKLGQETANLQFRVGLHSGPVTAGVLRGERARFQLFGDTVNTASRMESNGVPGRIQASEATATLLKAGGKKFWLTEREGGIEAKGKGRLRTFFVDVSHGTRSSNGKGSTRSGDTSDSTERSEDYIKMPTFEDPEQQYENEVEV